MQVSAQYQQITEAIENMAKVAATIKEIVERIERKVDAITDQPMAISENQGEDKAGIGNLLGSIMGGKSGNVDTTLLLPLLKSLAPAKGSSGSESTALAGVLSSLLANRSQGNGDSKTEVDRLSEQIKELRTELARWPAHNRSYSNRTYTSRSKKRR